MARTCIEGFPHRPGGHCGSTAMRDVLAFYGHDLSEEMVFGLGSGIDFLYVERPGMEPPVHIGGRTADLEQNLCDRLGIRMEVVSGRDAEQGWLDVKSLLDRGTPVIVHADVFHLDYLRARRHFSAHRIVILGYDEEKGVAYVGDNDRDEVQECSLASLARARSSEWPPAPADQAYYLLSVPAVLTPVEVAIVPAVEEAVRHNTRLSPDHASFEAGGARVALGMAGVRAFADALPSYPGSMTEEMLSATCRNIYVSAEKGGTGYGGNFRRMYGRFLIEAARFEGFGELAAVGREFVEIGDLWTRIALVFKELSGDGKKAVAEAHPLAVEAAEREGAAFEDLARITGDWGAG